MFDRAGPAGMFALDGRGHPLAKGGLLRGMGEAAVDAAGFLRGLCRRVLVDGEYKCVGGYECVGEKNVRVQVGTWRLQVYRARRALSPDMSRSLSRSLSRSRCYAVSLKHGGRAVILMEMVTSAVLVVVGLALLCFGGNWLVGGGEMIARRFRISSFVIGMTVVAYGTSTPELAASIVAAGEHSAIILGNVVGSNIANIGMVIGVSAILLPIIVGRDAMRRDVPIMLGASALLVVLSLDGEVSWHDGLALLGGLGIVTLRTIRVIRTQRADAVLAEDGPVQDVTPAEATAGTVASAKKKPSSAMFYARNVGMIGAGIGLLYAGAILTVDHAVVLAGAFGLSQKVIGLTVVAIGTSLPELVTSVMAIRRGQGDIGVGNIIGSNIYNVLMIMGVGAALGGVATSVDVYLDYGVMLAFGAALILMAAAPKTRMIGRPAGILLAAGYVAYLGLSLVR